MVQIHSSRLPTNRCFRAAIRLSRASSSLDRFISYKKRNLRLCRFRHLAAHIGILEKAQAVFVQEVDGPGSIKFDTYIGKCSPLHCTALGTVLLAFQSDEVAQVLLHNYRFDSFTTRTISSQAGSLPNFCGCARTDTS